jgi:D-glycerate 3-kinase
VDTKIPARLSPKIAALLKDLRLPARFNETVEHFYWPLAHHLASRRRSREQPLVVGINGPQGSGKSTLAQVLALSLADELDLPTAVLSLDDLYLTKRERVELAQRVHPLLATRGVPGTHDIHLGLATINSLTRAADDAITRIPRFDKSRDDRCSPNDWETFTGPAEIVILEGWCLGARAQPPAALAQPSNALERDEDADGSWRRYVNTMLADEYQTLFKRVDHLIFLQTPGFECVQSWRLLQEQKLAERLREENNSGVPVNHELMDEDSILRFIMHFERLTRHMTPGMAGYADTVIDVDKSHGVVGMVHR